MDDSKKVTMKEGMSIDLVLNIKGVAVEITFEYLGLKFTQGNVEFFKFISKTQTPFKQNLTLASINAMLPAPAVKATFDIELPA